MAGNREVSASITLNDNFTSPMSRITRRLDKAQASFAAFRDKVDAPVNMNTSGAMNKLSALGNKARDTGGIITHAIGSALGNLASNAITAGVGAITNEVGGLATQMQETQTSVNALQKVMEFKGVSKDFNKLSTDMSKLAASTNINTADANSYAAVLIGLGKDADYTRKTVEAVTVANQAFGGSGEAFQSVKTAMSQMASSGKVSAENMNQITDANAALGAALKSQVVDNFKKAGKQIDNFNDAVTDGQISVEDLEKAMIQLQKKGGKAVATLPDALDGMRETLASKVQPAFDKVTRFAAGKINGLADKVSDAFEKVDTGKWGSAVVDQFKRIGKVMGGVDMGSFATNLDKAVQTGIAKLGDLAVGAVRFYKKFKSVVDGGKNLLKEFKDGFDDTNAYERTRVAIWKVGDAIQHVADSLGGGDKVSKAMESLGSFTGEGIVGAADAIGKLADAVTATDPERIQEIANTLQNVAVAVVGFKAAGFIVGLVSTISGAAATIGGIITSIGGWFTGLAATTEVAGAGIGAAIGGIAWPLIAIAAVVAAVVSAWTSNFMGFRDFVGTAIDSVVESFGPFIDAMAITLQSLDFLIPVFQFLGAVIGGVVVGAILVLVGVLQTLLSLAGIVLQAIVGLGKAIWKVFTGDFKGAAKEAKNAISGIKETWDKGVNNNALDTAIGKMDLLGKKSKDTKAEVSEFANTKLDMKADVMVNTSAVDQLKANPLQPLTLPTKLEAPDGAQLNAQLDSIMGQNALTLSAPTLPEANTAAFEQSLTGVTVNAQTLESKLPQSATIAVDGFGANMSTGAEKAKTTMKTATDDIVSSGKNAANKMPSVGLQISNGLASGINSGIPAVTDAANKLVAEANRAAQAKAEIHSPSRLFRDEVGKQIGAGMAVGITQSTAQVDAASSAMIGSALNASTPQTYAPSPVSTTNNNSSNQQAVTITVQSGAFQINGSNDPERDANILFDQFERRIAEEYAKNLINP
jgi:tape measure domain-containing protein